MSSKKTIGKIQLGKQGVNDNFIGCLKNHFNTHLNVRISVLKNARPEGSEGKKKVKEMSEEIVKQLGENFTARIIGFTIIIKKWRKARR